MPARAGKQRKGRASTSSARTGGRVFQAPHPTIWTELVEVLPFSCSPNTPKSYFAVLFRQEYARPHRVKTKEVGDGSWWQSGKCVSRHCAHPGALACEPHHHDFPPPLWPQLPPLPRWNRRKTGRATRWGACMGESSPQRRPGPRWSGKRDASLHWHDAEFARFTPSQTASRRRQRP